MATMQEMLRSGFDRMDIPLPDGATERFEKYYDLLQERNRVMNLTAISGMEDVVMRHFLDCAALLSVAPMQNASVVDVGTGAGFPGLVLKIAQPSIQLTLLDSLNKRIEFLSEACELLSLDNVRCVHGRAEEASDMRDSFDFATSRAVARLSELCELCLPLVRVDGAFLAMKGSEPSRELEQAQNAIETLGGELERVFEYEIPHTDIHHSAVIIRKIAKTPEKYPRRFARIQKSPL